MKIKIALFASLLFLSNPTFADVAPSPDDPCFEKKEGQSCKTYAGEPGACAQTCYDREGPDGEVMYQTCRMGCDGSKTATADSFWDRLRARLKTLFQENPELDTSDLPHHVNIA